MYKNFLIIIFLIISNIYYKENTQQSYINVDNEIIQVNSELSRSMTNEMTNLEKAMIISEGNIINYKIEYPYFDDYSNEIMNKVNKLIYESAFPEDIFEFFKYKDYTEDIQITYEIKFINDSYLSILFSGYCSTGGSYADYKKGVTIDLVNGKILSLGNFLSFSELQSIINNLIETDKCTVFPRILDRIENRTNIKLYCLSFFNNKTILDDYNHFYIKKNKICLIGDYYPSMKEYVITEFDIN